MQAVGIEADLGSSHAISTGLDQCECRTAAAGPKRATQDVVFLDDADDRVGLWIAIEAQELRFRGCGVARLRRWRDEERAPSRCRAAVIHLAVAREETEAVIDFLAVGERRRRLHHLQHRLSADGCRAEV